MIMAVFSFIGFQEIVIILFITVLVFGPKKIPEIARGLGEGLRAMREATDEIKREVMESAEKMDVTKDIKKVQEDMESEINEAKKGIEDAVGPVTRKRL